MSNDIAVDMLTELAPEVLERFVQGNKRSMHNWTGLPLAQESSPALAAQSQLSGGAYPAGSHGLWPLTDQLFADRKSVSQAGCPSDQLPHAPLWHAWRSNTYTQHTAHGQGHGQSGQQASVSSDLAAVLPFMLQRTNPEHRGSAQCNHADIPNWPEFPNKRVAQEYHTMHRQAPTSSTSPRQSRPYHMSGQCQQSHAAQVSPASFAPSNHAHGTANQNESQAAELMEPSRAENLSEAAAQGGHQSSKWACLASDPVWEPVSSAEDRSTFESHNITSLRGDQIVGNGVGGSCEMQPAAPASFCSASVPAAQQLPEQLPVPVLQGKSWTEQSCLPPAGSRADHLHAADDLDPFDHIMRTTDFSDPSSLIALKDLAALLDCTSAGQVPAAQDSLICQAPPAGAQPPAASLPGSASNAPTIQHADPMQFANGAGSWNAEAVLQSAVQVLSGSMEDQKQPTPGRSSHSPAESHTSMPGLQHEGRSPSVLLHSNNASMPGRSTAGMHSEPLMQHAPGRQSNVPQQIVGRQESQLLKLLHSLAQPAIDNSGGPALQQLASLRDINSLQGVFTQTERFRTMQRGHMEVCH